MPQIRRALPPYDWNAVLRLIRTSFAYMEGRIDPPSALHRLTAQDIAAQSESAEIWVIEENNAPVACVFLTPRDDVLYLGKLAVAQTHRGRGLARRLVSMAEARALELGLTRLEAKTRVELVENHMAFATMGFRQIGQSAHDGYEQPTRLTLRKEIRGRWI